MLYIWRYLGVQGTAARLRAQRRLDDRLRKLWMEKTWHEGMLFLSIVCYKWENLTIRYFFLSIFGPNKGHLTLREVNLTLHFLQKISKGKNYWGVTGEICRKEKKKEGKRKEEEKIAHPTTTHTHTQGHRRTPTEGREWWLQDIVTHSPLRYLLDWHHRPARRNGWRGEAKISNNRCAFLENSVGVKSFLDDHNICPCLGD